MSNSLEESLKLVEELEASAAATQGIIPPPNAPAQDDSGNQAINLLTSIRDLIGQLVTAENAEHEHEDVPDADDKDMTENPDDYDFDNTSDGTEDGDDNAAGENAIGPDSDKPAKQIQQ